MVFHNLFSEHYDDQKLKGEAVDASVALVRELTNANLDAYVSVKSSQVRLSVSDGVFKENFARIVGAVDYFVWLNMEGRGRGCVQPNLERTRGDLRRFADLPGESTARQRGQTTSRPSTHKRKEAVNQAYQEYLEFVLCKFNGRVAVGSHDSDSRFRC